MAKQCEHYTAGQKVSILRRRLLEHVPVSKLCDERSLQPTVFYRWQKEFLRTARRHSTAKPALTRPRSTSGSTALEGKLQRRNEALVDCRRVTFLIEETSSLYAVYAV